MAKPEPRVGRLFLAGGVRPTSNSTALVEKYVKQSIKVKSRFFFMTDKEREIGILNWLKVDWLKSKPWAWMFNYFFPWLESFWPLKYFSRIHLGCHRSSTRCSLLKEGLSGNGFSDCNGYGSLRSFLHLFMSLSILRIWFPCFGSLQRSFISCGSFSKLKSRWWLICG